MAENGEDKLIAVARHIAKTLGRTETMADDILQIFSTFDGRFSREKMSENDGSYSGLERTVIDLDQRMAGWGIGSDFSTEPPIWSDSSEAAMFLDAVDELVATIQEWEPLAGGDKTVAGVVDRAETLLQQAMFKLEEEFRFLIERNSEAVDPCWLFEEPSGSNDDDGSKMFDSEEEEEEPDSKIPVAQQVTDFDFVIDMLPNGIVSDIHEIAKRMVAAGFGKECCHVYSSLRREFLEESISRLGIERFSIEDVQKMPWLDLEEALQKWIQALKVSLHIFFPSERRLCNRVFANLSSSVSQLSFMEVCRGTTIQLLNFADAFAISSRGAPERLFRLLDMYETLRDLLPEFNNVFSTSYCAILRSEAIAICKRSGEAIRSVFMELENLIQRDPAKGASVPGGGVHPITRYVMNYMKAACGSRQTLEQVFAHNEQTTEEAVIAAAASSSGFSVQTAWIMELLERNLESKSKMYRDQALSYIFLMNNGIYIVQKVKDSELGFLLGDDWIRKHNAKIRQQHTNYQRSSWGKVLACLKLDGVNSSGSVGGSSHVSRDVKDKLKAFNLLFDEFHRAQTSWVVSDDQLRTELRISVVEFLLPAYRSFVGRFQNVVEAGKHADKYIKYSPEDMELLINELFQGSPVSFAGRKL